MKLPPITDAARYQGLYVVHFGDQTNLGYTAAEVASLLEHEAWRDAKVYRIHRAYPDGRMELKGVPVSRFQLESGLFFIRADRDAARRDFADLKRLAESTPPPGRAYIHLAEQPAVGDRPASWLVALIYPAEHDEDISAWLSDAGYAGGDFVEGGPSMVTRYYEAAVNVLERAQLWPATSIPSRSREELRETLGRAVQR
jgi:hypothetical protein